MLERDLDPEKYWEQGWSCRSRFLNSIHLDLVSGGNGIGLRLQYLHLGTLGRNLRGSSAVPGHHSHLLPQDPKACLQMSQAPCQAQTFREIRVKWRH